MEQEKIYLSIPNPEGDGFTGWKQQEAKKAQEYYEELGHKVYNPYELSGYLYNVSGYAPTPFQDMAFALLHLSKADRMAVFPGYRDAPNCRLEMLLAALYNIPIVYAYSDVPILFDSPTLGCIQSLKAHQTFPGYTKALLN